MEEKRYYLLLSALVLGGIFYFVPILRAQTSNVVINEIYITGTDDWIELYNPTDNDIDLVTAGYRLERTISSGSNPNILLIYGNSSYNASYPKGTVIKAHGFYLHADNSVADQNLKNAADALAIGEASTGYLFQESAAFDIHDEFPDAKIIIILRNPVAMAFSLWQYMTVNGSESKSFEEAIRKTLYPSIALKCSQG